MVSAKTGAIVLCCFSFLALACSSVAAADAPPTPAEAPAGLKLLHPLGSGKNRPISLNLRPKHGRSFVTLMKQFVEAARAGKMDVMQLLQQQLFALTGPKHHKRHLLQATGPATDACPALPGSELITTPGAQLPPAGAGTAAEGALPSIRFATLEPCAEFGCRNSYRLVRQSDNTIACIGPRTPGGPGPRPTPVAVRDFAYFLVYDYDLFWNTDANNVLAGGYAGTLTTNNNRLTSKRGSLGLSSTLGSATQVRVQPNTYLGVRGDTTVSGEASTAVDVSRKVGDNAVLTWKTALPKISIGGTYGSVLPGTVVTDRDEADASDDNVVWRTNEPSLYAFGKKK